MIAVPNELDITEIAPRLWQGSAPPPGGEVKRAGFDLLVLAAYEYQPQASVFGGIHVIHAPMDDSKLTGKKWLQVVSAARTVYKRVAAGGTVLVTCAAGRNRSGIITAVALHLLTGKSGIHVVRRIQALRKDALTNGSFVQRLVQLRATTLSVGGVR